ncbi:hypothetical protein VroAM7_45680 [Vibrio rotiferianus]|uniref:Uncharacterized protein n=1 Tax=Vibrio rotiferianus TaxID=190895 RepID=A0A510IDP0_9VIBR|nr:hypothetical protein VroAM7_45680 [Vibrio rotiferianus]
MGTLYLKYAIIDENADLIEVLVHMRLNKQKALNENCREPFRLGGS